MNDRMIFLILFVALTACGIDGESGNTGELKILVATASNTQYVMREVIVDFEKKEGVKVELVVASSGKLASQIENGAPFHIFLSANMKFPDYLHGKGFAAKPPQVYALGSLVLWTNTNADLSEGVQVLRNKAIKKIAIANDKNAPYGVATRQVLENIGMLNEIHSKLVYGESISQVNHFVKTKLVDVGFTSKSVVLSRMKGTGTWADIAPSLYDAIEQGVVITKRGEKEHLEICERFLEHLMSPGTQQVFVKYGYLARD